MKKKSYDDKSDHIASMDPKKLKMLDEKDAEVKMESKVDDEKDEEEYDEDVRGRHCRN